MPEGEGTYGSKVGRPPFKMRGHTLPGINQRSEGNTDLPGGRSKSSAFQKNKEKVKVKTTITTPNPNDPKSGYSMTKSGGGKSATYKGPVTEKRKGANVITWTSPSGRKSKSVVNT